MQWRYLANNLRPLQIHIMIERNNRLHTRYGKIQFENKLTGENRIYDAIIIKIVNEWRRTKTNYNRSHELLRWPKNRACHQAVVMKSAMGL